MWLFILLMLVVSCSAVDQGSVAGLCDSQWYVSLGTPIRTTNTDDPVSWEQIDEECSHDFRGYRLLRQDYRQLTDKERTACGGKLVPLGLRKINSTLVWINRLGMELEKVDEKERNYMTHNGYGDGTLGALNLTSGYWQLVKNDHLFDCALCQSAKKSQVSRNKNIMASSRIKAAVIPPINRTKFDNLLEEAELANHNFKEEIRSFLLMAKSKRIKDIGKYIKKNSSCIKSISTMYKSIYKSKVNVLNEGGHIIRKLAKTPVFSSQLDGIAGVGSDLIALNSDSDLDLDMDFYSETLEINKINQLLSLLRTMLKVEDNFLWATQQSTSKIIKNIEKIILNAVLDDWQDVVIAETVFMTLIVANLKDMENPVVGFTMTEDVYHYTFQAIHANELHLITNNSTYTALLPQALVKTSTRLAFSIIINKNLIFPKKILRDDTLTYLTPVINVILSNKTDANVTSSENEYIDFMFNSVLSKDRKSISKYVKRECSYWNSELRNWTTDGCVLINSTHGILDMCRCKRTLTQHCDSIKTGQYIIEDWHDYGDYLKNVIPRPKNKPLGYISLVGYSLTLLGLLGILVTDIIFKTWRKELSSAVLLHLSIALILYFSFLVVVTLIPVQPNGTACIIIGVALHYSMLACFSWILVMSLSQLIRLYKKQIPNNLSLIFMMAFLGWGIPLIPILTTLTWDIHIYNATISDDNCNPIGGPSFIAAVKSHHLAVVTLLGRNPPVDTGFCYPTGIALHMAERVPMACILICNCVVFIITLCRIYSCSNSGKKDFFDKGLPGAMSGLITCMVMVLMFWLPWIFGFLANEGKAVFSYLFCIVVSTQGLVLFVLFVVVDNTARDCWRNVFRTRDSYSLSSDTASILSTTPPVSIRRARIRSIHDPDHSFEFYSQRKKSHLTSR